MILMYDNYTEEGGKLSLAEALKPEHHERDFNYAENIAKAYGELAALLVEKEVITLEEAIRVSGNYYHKYKIEKGS